MEISKEEKQNYLFEEIIDKGYNPEEFQKYIYDVNQSEVDLNEWGMNDLKEVVQKFKAYKNQDITTPEAVSSTTPIAQDTKTDSKIQKFEQSGRYLQFNYETKTQYFSQVINCIQEPPNDIFKQDVNIKIIRFDKKEGGIFEQSYVSYIVHTSCLGATVERRYSDFMWLKGLLEKLHPGLPVPPVAKKGQFRRYDDKHLNKRRMILQVFLNKIVEIPELKADQVFEKFLKIGDIVTFEKFKSQFKVEGHIPLTQVKNIRGKISIGIEPKINNFLAKSQKVMMETQPLMKKLYKQYKQVATLLESCSAVLQNISKICHGMNKMDRLFRKDTELKYCNSNMCNILEESSKSLADFYDKQALSIRTELYPSLKYESLNLLNALQALDKLKADQQQYVDAKNSLFKKKQRLYEQGNMSKWGLNSVPASKPEKSEAIKMMLPKQTEDLSNIRIKYASKNFQIYEEVNRHYNQNGTFVAKNLMTFVKSQVQLSSMLMILWVDSQTQITSMQEGRSIMDVEIGT